MSHCATIVFPDGSVARIRPISRAFIVALLQPTIKAAVIACQPLGVKEPAVRAFRAEMTALTEVEVVRAVATLELARIAAAYGVNPAQVAAPIVEEEIGVLDPANVVARRFQRCWRRVKDITTIDMPLARTQRINEVRIVRKPRLEKSDVDLLRAQETANVIMQDALKNYRQTLRDLPATEQPTIDAITTPEELALWEPKWPVDPAS
jgi:hypothetical protein